MGYERQLGPLAYEKREGPVFLGMQQSAARDYSDSKAQEIDAEVFGLVKRGHDAAVDILKKNMTALHNMAGALLEYETIDADEVNLLVQGGSLEEFKKLRDSKKEQIERDRKLVRESTEKMDKADAKKKASGGGDPVPAPA